MKKTWCAGLLCVLAVCGVARVVFAGTVEVTGNSAHDGVFGMDVWVDGAGDKGYVEDHSPAGERVYRASFWFRASDLELAGKTGHVIFQGVGQNADGDAGEVPIFEIELSKAAKNNRTTIRALSYYDAQPRPKKVATKSIIIDRNGWNHVLLEWRASTSNASPDGLIRLSMIGGTKEGKTVKVSGRVQNARHELDKIRMGAVRGVDATTYGSQSFDTFESFRTLGSE